MRNTSFEILIASLPNYESVVAEIYFDGLFVAIISQEIPGVFILETPGVELNQTSIVRKVEWIGFQTAVEMACKRLSLP